MIRHQNKWLTTDIHNIDLLIDSEIAQQIKRFGPFNSPHELYAVILEEMDEFWETVKVNDPDLEELLQIVALAKRGILELCEAGRNETKS